MARPFAFEKEERLSKKIEFETVLRRGSSLRITPVRLFFVKKKANPSRLGIWVSKREFKRAVDRNRIKRWVREFFRRRKEAFLFPCDVIVQVARRGESENHVSLDAVLAKIFREAGFLKS